MTSRLVIRRASQTIEASVPASSSLSSSVPSSSGRNALPDAVPVDQGPSKTRSELRAERALKQEAQAQIGNQQVADEAVRRDANTARLKALRLERDRLQDEVEPKKPEPPASRQSIKRKGK